MSSGSENCVGLTKMVTATRSHSTPARSIKERWPSWSAPIVGTSPIERLSRRAASRTERKSELVSNLSTSHPFREGDRADREFIGLIVMARCPCLGHEHFVDGERFAHFVDLLAHRSISRRRIGAADESVRQQDAGVVAGSLLGGQRVTVATERGPV